MSTNAQLVMSQKNIVRLSRAALTPSVDVGLTLKKLFSMLPVFSGTMKGTNRPPRAAGSRAVEPARKTSARRDADLMKQVKQRTSFVAKQQLKELSTKASMKPLTKP